MRSKHLLLGGCVVVTLILGFLAWLLRQKITNHQVYSRQEAEFLSKAAAPIAFYGKIIDQHGDPVSDADVKLQPNSLPVSKAIYQRTSDSNGEFSITGINGLSLYVGVSKPGYYKIFSKDGQTGSAISYAYGINLGYGIHHPDPSKPAILMLQKAGEQMTLLQRPHARIQIPKDGTPVKISLHPDRSLSHQIEVSCRTQDQNIALNQPYNWSYKITIPNGEIAIRNGRFSFEAPEDGYQTADAYEMKANMPREAWKDFLERSYFIRYKDGVYARIDIEMATYGQHVAIIDSFLNPKPGSRNLEADPYKH